MPQSLPESIIHESQTLRLVCTSDETGKPILEKRLQDEFPDPREILQLQNELEITQALNVPGIRRAYELTQRNNRYVLRMEYFDGVSLNGAFVKERKPLEQILLVATRIAEVLGHIHQQNIIHKDINKNNILVHPHSLEVCIIDFGISSQLDVKTQHLGNPEKLEGTLTSISPEQTGRMNRVVDYRTDIYSLGIVLYEMLVGRPPFVFSDPLELVHHHIAKTPVAPHILQPGIPEAVSDITMKLLAKNAEDRYQSAFGLKADLDLCLQQVRQTGRIQSFPLAASDASGRFHLPQKLYGREADIRLLLDAFERVNRGTREAILVSGYSGVGKSVLVAEIHKPVTGYRGYFLSGKFDQFRQNLPYSAFQDALKEFVGLLLTEAPDTFAQWKERIARAVGDLGKVLTTLVPSLELVLGPQPDVPELEGAEAQNRFLYVFRLFLNTICRKEHPIVLFIDDLQWADSASLELLKTLLTDRSQGYFLFIGSYRNNEVHSAHPLTFALEEIRAIQGSIQTIELDNLAFEHVEELISDALRTPREQAHSLAQLTYEKTKGNPFFVGRFLRTLYEEHVLRFSFEHMAWEWDVEQIRRMNISDNVVDLLTGRIRQLPERVQHFLQHASCFGNRFDLSLVNTLLALQPSDLKSALFTAVAEGFLMPLSGAIETKRSGSPQSFQFVHDRIRQAVHTMIDENDVRRIHWRIGKMLLKTYPIEEQMEHLIDIVHQLNMGRSLVDDHEEKRSLAELNLHAGNRAELSAAYEPALSHFTTGIELLPENAWEAHYDSMLALSNGVARTAFLTGKFERMEAAFADIVSHARNELDMVTAYSVRIDALTAQNRLPEGLQTGVEILEKLGEKFPKKPKMAHIFAGLFGVKGKLIGKRIEQLEFLPEMSEPRKIAAMYILKRSVPAAYMSGNPLFPLIVFRMVTLSVKYGNMVVSPFGYASFGITLSGVLDDFNGGYRFSQMSLRLIDRYNSELFKVQVLFVDDCFIRHFKEHLSVTTAPLLEAYQMGLRTGNLVGGTWSAYYRLLWFFNLGKELPPLEKEAEQFSESFRHLKQDAAQKRTELLRRVMQNLMGQTQSPAMLGDSDEEESERITYLQNINDKTSVFFFHFNKMWLAYLFGDTESALKHSDFAKPYQEAVTGLPDLVLYYFYDSLIRLDWLFRQPGDSQRKAFLKRIRKQQRRLRKWSNSVPMNYAHKYHLVTAELLRLKGRANEAHSHYDLAITQAKENGYIHEEAIAAWRAGEFTLAEGKRVIAQFYLREAYAGMKRWKARAVVQYLLRTYPEFLSTSIGELHIPYVDKTEIASHSTETTALDVHSVLKASSTLSEEIVLDKLLGSLLQIVTENAGAQSGVLILARNGSWFVEGRWTLDGGISSLLESIPLATCDCVSDAVVNTVRRRQETLVLEDASNDLTFEADPYIRKHNVRSVLCQPLISRGKLTGILYLENNLVVGCFTPDRIEVLNILLSHAAVSIENASLYANLSIAKEELERYSHTLERKVSERTAELSEKNAALEQAMKVLKDTQQQLITQEKLASLGSLTAGIAHEIRNPLNFINNFASLTNELLQEIEDSRTNDEELSAILQDAKNAVQRIEEHGQRADGIVRSMMLHARSSGGEKEEVDVHSLLDESVNLTYHAMRSEDAGFNLSIQKQYADDVPPVFAIPQDLSRVFLNLMNNACYAMAEKRKKAPADYLPSITINTTRIDNRILISIADNGTGIPAEVREKIFNPFFTTKPTGKGTGLGLSISYDIITQGHGGEMSVVSKDGIGAEFRIALPVS